MKRFSYLIIFLLFGLLPTFAADMLKLQAPSTVVEGQKFQIKYVVASDEASSFTAPNIEGCELIFGPAVSTSSSISIINGKQSSSYQKIYSYTYNALTRGKYTIPAVTVKIEGRNYSTSPTSLEVLPPDSRAQNQNKGSNTQPSPSATTTQTLTKDDIFIRVILNKKEVYEQEPIEMTVKLYSRSNSVRFVDKAPDSYDGFLVEEISGSGQWENLEHYNGSNYYTSVLRRAVLFPQKTGELTVGSGSYEAIVTEYQREVIGYMHIATIPVERNILLDPGKTKIKVLPLPQPAPSGFNGAVGHFSMTSKLSDTALRTGDAAMLTVTVAGSGNFKGMSAPEISFPVEFEQYTPREEQNVKVANNTLTGSTTYEYTFVPQAVGKFTIPAIQFSYFDPTAREYKTISSESMSLDIARGNLAGGSNNPDQQNIIVKNTDIKHIKEGDKGLSFFHTLVARQWWYWMIYPFLILILVVSIAGSNSYRRSMANVTGRKISNANRVARKRLKAAASFLRSNNSEKMSEEILKALWGYLSDKLAIPVSELSRSNITEILIAAGSSESTINKVISAIDSSEMARYSGTSSDLSSQSIYDLAVEAINSLESTKLRK